MREIVRNAIKRIYLDKDFDMFRTRSQMYFELHDEIDFCINNLNGKYANSRYNIRPYKSYWIDYEKYIRGEYEASYLTIVEISKIIPIFQIYHQFSIDNIDENKFQPSFCEYREKPYTKSQLKMEEEICKILYREGYTRLSEDEMNEVVVNIDLPEDRTFFGSQATVEILLFKDVFDIIDDDEEEEGGG